MNPNDPIVNFNELVFTYLAKLKTENKYLKVTLNYFLKELIIQKIELKN